MIFTGYNSLKKIRLINFLVIESPYYLKKGEGDG